MFLPVDVFYGLKAQLLSMAENGGGSTINMASTLGSVGFPRSSAYVRAMAAPSTLWIVSALRKSSRRLSASSPRMPRRSSRVATI